ncbi:MAG: peptidoglycan-binding domain-containing protein [Pseudomonadota bacterium]
MRGLFALCLFAMGIAVGAIAVSTDKAPDPSDIIASLRAQGAAGFAALTPAIAAEPKAKYVQSLSTAPSDTAGTLSSNASVDADKPRTTPADVPRAINAYGARSDGIVIRQAPVLVRPAKAFAFVDDTARDALGARTNAAYPFSPAERSNLIAKLQRELRRAGCYNGKIDGSWGSGSKRGISTFLSRVNSALPIEEPDYFQLALIRSHPGQVCGAACASGQTLSASGKCIARPVIASTPALIERGATAGSANTATRPKIQTGSVSRSASRTAALASKTEQLPIVVPSPRLVRAPAPSRYRQAPLPGRMALSGPSPTSIPATERAPGVSSLPSTSTQIPTTPQATQVEKKRKITRPASQPKKTARKRTASVKRKRSSWSKQRRQRQIMRQAFGDSMF